MQCPYCNTEAIWVENKIIYGKNYGKSYMCYYCKKCDSYVGCHNNTREALGTMANKELREWRKKAHKEFDPFWKKWGMKRNESYKLMQGIMGMTEDEAHIANFDVNQCKKLVEKIRESKEKQDGKE